MVVGEINILSFHDNSSSEWEQKKNKEEILGVLAPHKNLAMFNTCSYCKELTTAMSPHFRSPEKLLFHYLQGFFLFLQCSLEHNRCTYIEPQLSQMKRGGKVPDEVIRNDGIL